MEKIKKFQRKIEDFKCLNCREEVFGNGFTNHCPKCIWSQHVDLNPGDRRSKCLGEMKPKEVYRKNGKNFIVHKCQKCGLEKNNKISKNDEFEKVVEITANS